MVSVKLVDMRITDETRLKEDTIAIVNLSRVPCIGETVHWDGDDSGFVVKSVMHVVGSPPTVRGW